jgi:ADP-ribose pyrophosphatase
MTDRPTEPWKLLHSTYSFRDRWLTLRSDTVALPSGETLSPYHVIESADWVNAIALTDDGNIVLVEQYRHAVQQTMLELPAGHVDAGETPEAAVKRELIEETGCESTRWHDLGAMFPAASRLNNKVHSYLALGVRQVREPVSGGSEVLRVRSMPWATFVAGLYSGDMVLREAAQFASIFLLHLYAKTSDDPAIAKLRV